MAERPGGRSRDHANNQATIGNGNRAGNDDLAVKESESTVAVSRCRRGPLADVASEAPPSFRTQHIPPHFFRNTRARALTPSLSLSQACRMCTPQRRFFAPPRVSPLSGLLNKAAMCMSQPDGGRGAVSRSDSKVQLEIIKREESTLLMSPLLTL